MKKLYDKNELSFGLVWIAIYCALQSFANPINEMIGVGYSERTTCRNGTGFAERPFPPGVFFTMCRFLFWHREISGTVSPSTIHRRKLSAVSRACSV